MTQRINYKLQQNVISGKLLNNLIDFLNNRKQRVGALLFLIYINDLPEGLIINAKLFCIFFLVVRDIVASTEELNNDLRNISKWAYQWKMIFKPDLTREAQEVVFSRKLNKPVHPNLIFNKSQVSQTKSQKHLSLILDNKVNFNEHLKGVLDKISKTIGLICKLQPIIPRFSLLTIYKTFFRQYFDYGDMIYDQTCHASFHRELESIQYSACLPITDTIRGTSHEKLNQELDLEILQSR